MDISLVVRCLILKALKSSGQPMNEKNIQKYVISKMRGIRSKTSLKQKISMELDLFLQNDSLMKDKNDLYFIPSLDIIKSEDSPKSEYGHLFKVGKKYCEAKLPMNLDPNYRAPRDLSEDSMSGDEIELACKRLHTNTKCIKHDEVPVHLPNAKKIQRNESKPNAQKININETCLHSKHEDESILSKSTVTDKLNNHICILPKDGLKEYEILSVISPTTRECCGSLIFLPFDLRSSFQSKNKRNCEMDEFEPPSKNSRLEHVDETIQYDEHQTMIPDSDELKPPKYSNSHL